MTRYSVVIAAAFAYGTITTAGILGLARFDSLVMAAQDGTEAAQSSGATQSDDEQFRLVRRSGSVDLDEYDLTGLSIPRDEIHTLLPRDAIPALVDPAFEWANEADWLDDQARIIVAKVGDERIGVPLAILDWHEIVNTTLGGEPIAVTYCPLCDSATVFSRVLTLPADEGEKAERIVLEFGVSGALYNSNVLMYDHRNLGLWSQLGMHAVSGPLVGQALSMLPVELISFQAMKETYGNLRMVSRETGHRRAYGSSPYASFFEHDRLLVAVRGVGEALPRKTLGIGVATDEESWFIPEEVASTERGYELTTPHGLVRVVRTDAGLAVAESPASGVRTAQTFYYAWSAFYPQTRVIQP